MTALGVQRRAATSEALVRAPIPTPVGNLIIVADDTALRAVLWNDTDAEWRRAGLNRRHTRCDAAHPVLHSSIEQLTEWFTGARHTIDIPHAMDGTDFQHAVWTALTHIAYGHTRTYAEVAADIGRPSAVRAVAGAIGRNPLSIVVPCHRVIGANGQLTGFAGGIAAKAALLAIEGTIIPHDGQAHRRS